MRLFKHPRFQQAAPATTQQKAPVAFEKSNKFHRVTKLFQPILFLLTTFSCSLLAMHPVDSNLEPLQLNATQPLNDLLDDAARQPTSLPKLLLSEAEQTWISNNPVIRYAVHPTFQPLEYIHQGRHLGLSADYIHQLEIQLGLKFQLIKTASWKESLQLAYAGKVDLLPLINQHEQHEQYLVFSETYYYNPKVIISNKPNDSISSPADLSNKRVVMAEGFLFHEQMRSRVQDKELFLTNEEEDSLLTVALGLADATVINLAIASITIEQHNLKNLRVVGDFFDPTELKMAVRKDLPELWILIKKGLANIAYDQRRKMEKHWVTLEKRPFADEQPIELTDVERQWLLNHPIIRLGVDPNFDPFGFIDKWGAYRGIASDYFHILNRRLGLNLKLVKDLTWPGVINRTMLGEIDVLPIAGRSTYREQFLDFTNPYTSSPTMIFTRFEEQDINNAKDLNGRTVAVNQGSYIYDRLLQSPEIHLTVYPSTLDAIQAVSNGSADAYITNQAHGSKIIGKYALSNIKVAATLNWGLEPLGIAVRSDWPELVAILNKGLESITPAEAAAIRGRWIGLTYENYDKEIKRLKKNLPWIYGGVGFVFILSLLTFAWNHKLKNENQKRKKIEHQLIEKHTALEEKSAILSSVLDNMTQGLVAFDKDLRLLAWNEKLTSVRGYPKEMLTAGRSFEEFMLYDLDHNEFKVADKQAELKSLMERARGIEQHHFERSRSDGKFIEVSGGPMPGGGFVSTFTDISARRQAEDELKKAKLEADQASISKSRFLANMSHEIRTPMNAIVGMCYLTLQTNLDHQQRGYLNTVQAASKTLLNLINDILDLSKIEAGKLTLENIPFCIADVLNEVVRFHSLKAEEKGIELYVDLDPDIPADLIGDPMRLQQILSNLVGNALKFTQQGEVLVSLDKVHQTPDHVTLNFIVRDTGIGVKPEVAKKIFMPFQQADDSTTRQFGGTGLGLSICRQLVEFMGGKIELTSVPGEGSSFHFHIRFTLQQNTEKNLSAHLPQALKILVVDNKPTAQKIIGRLLHSFHWDFDLVESTEQAVDAIDRKRATYDLVIVDFNPAACIGIETGKQVQQLSNPAIPVIIMANTYGSEKIQNDVYQAGLQAMLVKPIMAQSLIVSITKSLQPDFSKQMQEQGFGESVPNLSGGKILLVEDNPVNQLVAVELLERTGAEVTQAQNGLEALELLEKTAYDLILMDIQMPVMDGLEATKKIRADGRFTHLPIIALTAHALPSDRERCLDVGMNDHLAKPIDPLSLYHCLERFMGRNARENTCSLTGKQVLLVDDSLINRQIANELMSQCGINVKEAEDGQQALECIKENHFDLILMDLEMPHLDGHEATIWLKKQPDFKDIPVIVLSSKYRDEIKRERQESNLEIAQFDDFLEKPIDPEKLKCVLKKWLSQTPSSQVKSSAKPSETAQSDEPYDILLPASNEHLDVVTGLRRIAGNRKLYATLLADFVRFHQHDPDKILHAINANEWETAIRIPHTLVGVAGSIGAHLLSKQARSLESLLNQHENASWQDALTEMTRLLEQVIEMLVLVPHPDDMDLQKTATTDYLSHTQIMEQLDPLLAVSDISALEFVNRLNPDNPHLKKARQFMLDYDFEEARTLLHLAVKKQHD